MIEVQNGLFGKQTNCSIGILAMEKVRNTGLNKLGSVKRALENELQAMYNQATRKELKALHPMDAYVSYYRKFGYTYHVLPQLESVIQGKSIPDGLPLVEAMFMAELKNMILTAGHDLNTIKGLLKFMVSTGEERYTAMNGKTVTTVSGDIMIADQEAVISSILRGPDRRSAITKQTSRVLYAAYAPSGVDERLVHQHLSDIEWYVRMLCKESVVCFKQVYQDRGNV